VALHQLGCTLLQEQETRRLQLMQSFVKQRAF